MSKAEKMLPPGPEERLDLKVDEATFLKIPELFAGFGDIVRVLSSVRKSDTYLLNRPDHVKRVLVNNHRNYDKGYGFERVRMLLGNSIIASNGAFWRSQRRMIQPAFHKSVLAGLTGMMHDVNIALEREWADKARRGEPVDITRTTNRLALEVIMRGVFSDDYDWLNERCDLMALLADSAARDVQLVMEFRELRKIIAELLALRRARGSEERDLLAMLVAARDGEGKPMQEKHLIDEVVTLIVAGNETTASTMNWAWYLLSEYPEAARRVHAEVDAAALNSVPSFEDLDHFPFIVLLLNETLRLYPPGWLFSRKAIAEDRLGEYYVPAGTDILIAPYYLHRNQTYWEEPERFDPERFLDERFPRANKFAFIPFSAGPRRCIGDQFAMLEMQIHFAYMTRRFELTFIPERPITLEPAINLRTLHNFNMSVSARG